MDCKARLQYLTNSEYVEDVRPQAHSVKVLSTLFGGVDKDLGSNSPFPLQSWARDCFDKQCVSLYK